MFTRSPCLQGHHVYKDIWMLFVDVTLACQREEEIQQTHQWYQLRRHMVSRKLILANTLHDAYKLLTDINGLCEEF